MTKDITLIHNDKPETITVEDKPRAEVVLKLMKNCMKYKPGQVMPEVDFGEYLIGLATNLITKAPWTLASPDAIRALPWQTYAKLCEVLGDEFPLESFLFPVGKLMYGKKLSSEASATPIESTTNSPSGELPNDK